MADLFTLEGTPVAYVLDDSREGTGAAPRYIRAAIFQIGYPVISDTLKRDGQSAIESIVKKDGGMSKENSQDKTPVDIALLTDEKGNESHIPESHFEEIVTSGLSHEDGDSSSEGSSGESLIVTPGAYSDATERGKLTVDDVVGRGMKHVKREQAIIPGFMTFNIDTDIRLIPWRKTLHSGVYFVRESKGTEEIDDSLYILRFDVEAMEKAVSDATNGGGYHYEERMDENGNAVRTIVADDRNSPDLTIDRGATLEKVEIEDEKSIGVAEAAAWAAIGDAETPEERRQLFEASYSVKAGEITDDTEANSIEAVKQDTAKPSIQYDANSKLANSIDQIGFNELVDLDVSGRNEKPVVTSVSLEYDGEGVELSKPMTQYDREVHNAVVTIMKAGNSNFTTAQIWKTLSGSSKSPTRKQAEQIEKSIEKQWRTMAHVNFSQEARGRELDIDGEPVTSTRIDAHMLELEKIRLETANGRVVEGYRLLAIPVLYRHAAALNQVISYPVKLLDTASVASNTTTNILIKKYLLRRIGEMKGRCKLSKRILYATVYEKAGCPSPDRKQRMTMNKFIIGCMNLWKRDGVIKGFSEYSKGQKRIGVEIRF